MINFLSIEKFYLITIGGVGVILILIVSLLEKSKSFALFRARGIDKKTLINVQISESVVLLSIGTVISLISVFSAYILNNNMNSIFLFDGKNYSIPRQFVFPFIQIFLEITIFVSILLVTTYIATQFIAKKSDADNISTFLRMN